MGKTEATNLTFDEIMKKVGENHYAKDVEGNLKSVGFTDEQIMDMSEYSKSLAAIPAAPSGGKNIWFKTHGFWSVTIYFNHTVSQNIPTYAGAIATAFASMGPAAVLAPFAAAAMILGDARFKAVDKGKGVHFTLAYIAIPGLLTPATLCAYVLATLQAN